MNLNDRSPLVASALLIVVCGAVSVAAAVAALFQPGTMTARDAAVVAAVTVSGLVSAEYGIRRVWQVLSIGRTSRGAR